MTYTIIRLTFFILLIPSFAYSAERNLYAWLPLVNCGGLRDDKSDRISGHWGGGIIGVHHQVSPKVGVTGARYKLADYHAEYPITYSPVKIFDIVSKYRPDLLKMRLLSKTVHSYGQLGLWYACVVPLDTTNVFETEEKENENGLVLEGSGWLVGIGLQCALSSRFFVDLSGKRLVAVSFFHKDIQSSWLFSLGLGVRLW